MANTGDVNFEILEFGDKLGATSSKGWTKEINRVSWYGREPKLDIRDWNEDHTKCGSGLTLDDEEAAMLATFLQEKGYV